jgi:mycothiol S-conjugate amidase
VTEPLRLMCVHAHPDDESSKGAATMAHYRRAGVQVLVVSCTGGERGDILNPQLKASPEVARDIAEVRRREMAEAARILGVEHVWLGFVDSGLPEGDPLPPLPPGSFGLTPLPVAAEALVRVIRQFRPHVVTTYDENGGYPHPDHIRCHEVSVEAYHASGDPDRFPQAGRPWQPSKLYYNQTLSLARIVAVHEAMQQRDLESPYAEWIARWEERGERSITTRVPCGDLFETRDRALVAHATQVDPAGSWFSVPIDLQREIWPTEDFELAHSQVPVSLPEDDLFAGVEPTS